MYKFNCAAKLVFVALAITASVSTLAVPISSTSISGPHTIWGVSAPGLLTPGFGTIATALTGNAANPAGNVELSKFGGSVATLNGNIGSNPVTLSSLVLSDWIAGGNALATNYIQDAAMAAFGSNLSAPQLNVALNDFFNLDLDPGSGVLNPWQLVSDPNISYVNGDSGIVNIGLAGFLDASPVLSNLFGSLLPSGSLPPGLQVSEVVKVTYNGKTDYKYSFFATPSGYHTAAFPLDQSYTGNYEVHIQVPLPSVLWLLGIGFAGLMIASRRRSVGC